MIRRAGKTTETRRKGSDKWRSYGRDEENGFVFFNKEGNRRSRQIAKRQWLVKKEYYHTSQGDMSLAVSTHLPSQGEREIHYERSNPFDEYHYSR